MGNRQSIFRKLIIAKGGNNTDLTQDELEFCDKLRDLRIERGLTLEGLERISKVSKSTIQNIELRHTERNRAIARPGYQPRKAQVVMLMAAINKAPVIKPIEVEPITAEDVEQVLSSKD